MLAALNPTYVNDGRISVFSHTFGQPALGDEGRPAQNVQVRPALPSFFEYRKKRDFVCIPFACSTLTDIPPCPD